MEEHEDSHEEALQSWENFFSSVLVVLRETSEENFSLDQRTISYATARIENCLTGLQRIIDRLHDAATTEGMIDLISKAKQLYERFSTLYTFWNENRQSGDHIQPPHSLQYRSVVQDSDRTGRKGRPTLSIERSQVEYLRSLQFSWSEIASLLGIGRMTLYRRRRSWGMLGRGFIEITDEDVETLVLDIKAEMPDVGERMLLGALIARGVKVGRERLRRIIQKVDPVNTALRWSSFVVRRPYSVSGSNSLWHLGKF